MKKTNVPGSQSFGQKLLQFIRNNTVPIMFILICAYCIPQAGFSWSYLLNEVMTRLGRNPCYGRHGYELRHDAGCHGRRDRADLRR